MPGKSSRFARKTVVLTSRSSPLPAASRMARRLAKICSVCSSIVPPMSSVSPGLNASWPETNTSSPTTIACEYGAPWKGAGAASVRITCLSGTPYPAGLSKRDPEGLEDRLQDVLGVLAVDEPDVQRQPSSLRELLEKPRDDVALDAGDMGRREVDVRDDERAPGRLERDVRERLVGGHDGRPVAAAARDLQRLGEGGAERATRRRDLLVRIARSHLEGEIEPGVLGEQCEQVVDDRNTGRDVGPALTADGDTRSALPGGRHQASTRSMWAPSPRSRSSIRS